MAKIYVCKTFDKTEVTLEDEKMDLRELLTHFWKTAERIEFPATASIQNGKVTGFSLTEPPEVGESKPKERNRL